MLSVVTTLLIDVVTSAFDMGGVIGIVLATGASVLLARVMEVPYLFNPIEALRHAVATAWILQVSTASSLRT